MLANITLSRHNSIFGIFLTLVTCIYLPTDSILFNVLYISDSLYNGYVYITLCFANWIYFFHMDDTY